MPEVITVISSDCVMRARNGRIVNGASVWPMKMLAATFSDSAPLAPITLFITTANIRTMTCITPRKYRIANSAAMKMIVGRIWNAKITAYWPPSAPSVLFITFDHTATSPSGPKTNREPSTE